MSHCQVEGLVAKDYRGHAMAGFPGWNTEPTILVYNGEGCATRKVSVDHQHPDKDGYRGKSLVVHAKASDTVSIHTFSFFSSLHKCQKLRNLVSRALHGTTIDSPFINPLPFFINNIIKLLKEGLLVEHNPRLMVFNHPNLDVSEKVFLETICHFPFPVQRQYNCRWRSRSKEHLVDIMVSSTSSSAWNRLRWMRCPPSSLVYLPSGTFAVWSAYPGERLRILFWSMRFAAHSNRSTNMLMNHDFTLFSQAVGRLQGLSLGHPSLTSSGGVKVDSLSGQKVCVLYKFDLLSPLDGYQIWENNTNSETVFNFRQFSSKNTIRFDIPGSAYWINKMRSGDADSRCIWIRGLCGLLYE